MRIAIPLSNGRLSEHFGHCQKFALLDIDKESKVVTRRTDHDAPPHEPGRLPAWLAEHGANVIIAGGMGQRAQGLFVQQGITVLVGASLDTPENLVRDFLSDKLDVGENFCDH